MSWAWDVARRAVRGTAVSQGSTDACRRISEMQEACAHVLASDVARPAPTAQPTIVTALRSGRGGCGSISPVEMPSSQSKLHWMNVLERVTAEPQSSILTDSFGYVTTLEMSRHRCTIGRSEQ
jgi:hypothetical protein